MNTDQVAELLEYLHHAVACVDALGIIVSFLLGIVVALLVLSRR